MGGSAFLLFAFYFLLFSVQWQWYQSGRKNGADLLPFPGECNLLLFNFCFLLLTFYFFYLWFLTSSRIIFCNGGLISEWPQKWCRCGWVGWPCPFFLLFMFLLFAVMAAQVVGRPFPGACQIPKNGSQFPTRPLTLLPQIGHFVLCYTFYEMKQGASMRSPLSHSHMKLVPWKNLFYTFFQSLAFDQLHKFVRHRGYLATVCLVLHNATW